MHGDSIEARVGALSVQVDKLEQQMTEGFVVVDKRFEQVDKRFETLETDLRERRWDTNRGFERLDARLGTLSDNLEKTNRLIAQGAVIMTGGFTAGFAALIALFIALS
jgi:hypothetical protein